MEAEASYLEILMEADVEASAIYESEMKEAAKEVKVKAAAKVTSLLLFLVGVRMDRCTSFKISSNMHGYS